MKHVLVFVVRVVIFQGVFCLKLFVRSHYQLNYEVSTQVLVSSLQICIVFAAVMLYKMSRFVVYTINDGRHYATVEEEDDEETCSTRIERTDGMDDVQDVASTPSKPQIDTIVFAGSRSLREYVLCMHTLGILLWGTFYSFDFSTTVAFYYFVYGLLFGWLVRIWRAGPEINIVLCVVYVGLFATVMGINRPSWSSPVNADLLCFAVVLPVVFGVGWMSCIHDSTIVENAENALVTCVLVCCLVMSTSEWTPLFDMLARERALFVYVLVIEPVAKSLALYVFVLSLLTRHHQQILFVFVCMHALASTQSAQSDEPLSLVVTVSAVCVLFLLQGFRVCRKIQTTVV